MTLEEALKILPMEPYGRSVDFLGCDVPYISVARGRFPEACVDGTLSLEQLEALAVIVRAFFERKLYP